MVDGSALGADDLIAGETNRFEAKGAITVRFPPGAAVESQADLFVCSEGIARSISATEKLFELSRLCILSSSLHLKVDPPRDSPMGRSLFALP